MRQRRKRQRNRKYNAYIREALRHLHGEPCNDRIDHQFQLDYSFARDMFMKLIKITNVNMLCDGEQLKNSFNEWQKRLYDTYVKAISIKT